MKDGLEQQVHEGGLGGEAELVTREVSARYARDMLQLIRVGRAGVPQIEVLIRSAIRECRLVLAGMPVRRFWCRSHERAATKINDRGERCCDYRLGGKMIPCQVEEILP